MLMDKELQQRLFNIAFEGLRSQGFEFSMRMQFEPEDENDITIVDYEGTEICAYRGDEGRRCAIGYLIPDSKYNPEFEGQGVSGVVMEVLASEYEGLEVTEENKDWLSRLQNAHDNAQLSVFSTVSMEGELRAFAEACELIVPG